MPYIDKVDRNRIDDSIKNLASRLYTDGEINYAITKLLLMSVGNNKSYTSYNKVMGILECVKQEFYRRAVTQYEDQKKYEKGDVF